MRKIIVFLFVIMLLLVSQKKYENVVIPKDSIRFRIIANSNSNTDQKQKWDINAELIPILDSITKKGQNKNSVSIRVKENISAIRKVVSKYEPNSTINYGYNYFPSKSYHHINYPEGNYESLVITLGDGQGDNWWCVLFPPLCLMEAKKDNYDDITYTSYIKEIINNYF